MSAVDNNAAVTEVVPLVPPSPVEGQLVVASPVLALEALPPVESVPSGARPLYRTIENADRSERSYAGADHVASGEHMRGELKGHNFGDKWLQSSVVAISKKLTDAGSDYNLKADLVQVGRPDLVEDRGVSEIGCDLLKGTTRKALQDMGLKGLHFTHPEVKQLMRVYGELAGPDIFKGEVEKAETEARACIEGLDNDIESHNQTINGYDSQIIKMEQDVAVLNAKIVALQRGKTTEVVKIEAAQALQNGTEQSCAELMRIAAPLFKAMIARSQATASGIIGKSKKGSTQTHRDKGVVAALELNVKNWSPGDLTLSKAHRALLHTAQGNRDAMCINVVTATNAGAFSVAHLDHIMASAQAAKAKTIEQQAGPSGQ